MEYVRNSTGNILFWCPACKRHMGGNYCVECGSATRYATPEDFITAVDHLSALARHDLTTQPDRA